MQVPWSGSPLQAVEAAEADTGLGSGGEIDEGTGCRTAVGKGDTCGSVQQNKEVEEKRDKMEVGDTAD